VRIATIRTLVGGLLGAVSAIQLVTALYVATIGSFALQVGPLRILGTNAIKVFSVGVVAGCAAVWMLEPVLSAHLQRRVAAIAAWFALAAAVASAISLVAPVLSHGFPLGHDTPAHVTYLFLFDRAIGRGQFPVRWVEGLQDGMGQPVFNYYQVGFYYLVELIHRLGPGLLLSMKLAVAAASLYGAAFMFLLFARLGLFPGVVAASVFASSPYLVVDGYVRAAYPELTAVGFVPAVLWSIAGWFRTGQQAYLCAIAASTGLVAISHLPTTLIVAPVAVVFAIVQWRAGRHPARRLAAAGAGAALGAAMAAFYLLPAIFELGYIKIARLTTAYFDYHYHFVRPAWWLEQGWTYAGSAVDAGQHMSLQLGPVQWLVLAAAIAVLAVPQTRRQAETRASAIAGWLALAGAALFMMTNASTFIWDRIPPLAYVQFPWRLLMLPALACGALAALLLSRIRSRTLQPLVVICVVAVQWYALRDARRAIWWHPAVEIGIDDPAWPASANGQQLAFHEDGYDPSAVGDGPYAAAGRWTAAAGHGEIVADAIADARLALSITAPKSLRLVINSPYFPGWTVLVDGRAVTPTVIPGSAFMEISVPAGSHHLEARLENTALRAAANAMTLMAALIWIALAVSSVRQHVTGVRK
jgi:hypothetical protein